MSRGRSPEARAAITDQVVSFADFFTAASISFGVRMTVVLFVIAPLAAMINETAAADAAFRHVATANPSLSPKVNM